ncbi:uncharacterized protein pwn [Battus philenor]|uniref:uncharacterized protein pwn n=1 Tax=Battus philenor TaxID=42288 RepID=UPI0035D0F35B
MAARGRWRTRGNRITAVLFAILIQVVNGYEQMYTISQLSPKSAIDERLYLDDVLHTTQTENLALRIEPSVKFDPEVEPEDTVRDDDEVNHIIVERSADPNDRESRSINIDEIPTSNHNEIDNELELHNKRKYYEISPTKTLDFLQGREDVIVMSSEGFGDKLNFKLPGEAKRVPKGRALAPTGPKIRPSAVQPIFATATHREQGRQNSEIQNIITGIVKLLNGNVNVQANTQLLNGRPGRPMASRINNRGPPKISDVPPLPELDQIITPPAYAFHPTKTPPPYPFDRPPYHGVNLPEQIVPPVSPHRPGFIRPLPSWPRPRPWPPNRRPHPGLPIYKPTPPPPPIDIPNYDDRPEDEVDNENETSQNNIHHEDKEKEHQSLPSTSTEAAQEEVQLTSTEATTTSTSTTTTSTTTKSTTTKSTTTTTTTTTTEKPTQPTTEKQTEPPTESPTPPPTQPPTEKVPTTTTTEKPKTEVPITHKPHKDKETQHANKNDDVSKVEEKPVDKIHINESAVEQIVQPSIPETTSTASSVGAPTPTEGLISHAPASETVANDVIKSSSINSEPIPSSQGIPYHPYRPRPGIVLDDTDFKPHGSRYRPEASVITAPEPPLPGYGEIFDVTVSAIQGPGEKGGASVHIENVHAGGGDHDDIIVSAAGSQGFVSIDGKRTYLNLFDTTTTSIQPSRVQPLPHHSSPPQPPQTPQPAPQPALGPGVGTGVAIPADDTPPPRRTHTQHPLQTRPQTYRRPQPTVRIDTCIVGDDSTCDQAQNEKCRTEAGISSCQCRPGYARRIHRDPCRRVVSLILNLRVDRLYDRKVAWDNKLADKESEPYQQLSYEAIRAIDSAFSMTPFSDDFVSGSVNSIHKGDQHNQGVFVNYTVLMQETAETLRSSVATDIQKHLLGVIRRRSNNVGTSALWVDSPAGSVLPLADVDECASSDLNDCHHLASCTNTWGAFRCACPDTTLDVAAGGTRAGRECRACAAAHCSERGVCRYANGQPYCSCSSGYYGSACEVDGEVVGVAVGASLAAALVIALTLAALLSWSRKWSREQKAAGMGSPVFNYMAANTVKTPPVGQPPYQVTLEERQRWAQIAEAMAQANHYAPDPAQTMATRPSSALFGYPTLPPVPLPRMGVHGHHTGTMTNMAPRPSMTASHLNLYGYNNHMAESTSSEASSHVQDRTDLLVPRPKSRARSMHNQTGIYYDVEYENAPEPIYGSKGIPLSTYTVSRGPTFYRT